MGASYIFNFMGRFGIGATAAWLLTACGFHLSIDTKPNTLLPSLTITPTVEFIATAQSVTESAGTITITVEKTYATEADTIVPFTVGGTATSGTDHNLTSGSITITGGTTTGSATFTITDDLDPELNETVIVTLGTLDAEADNATLGDDIVHTVTITDDDSLVVAPFYSNAPDWNDYFVNNGTTHFNADDTLCSSSQTGSAWSCLHAGPYRKVTLSGPTSCTGFSARDDLDVFEWDCSASGGVLTFYSKSFKSGKSLRDLIDASGTSWAANSVILGENSSDIKQSASSSGWWNNPVAPLPAATAGVETLNAAGTVYTLTADADARGYIISADKIAIVTLGTSVLNWDTTGPANCNAGTQKCLLYSSSTNFLWLEGNFFSKWSAEFGARLISVKWSRLHNLAFVQNRRSGIYLTDASYTRLTNVTVAQANNRCAYINNGSRLIIQNMRLSSCNLGGLIMDVSGYFNTVTDIVVSGTKDWAGIYLAGAAGDGNVLSHMTVANGNFTAFGIRDVDNSNASQLLAINGGEEGMYIFSNAHGNRFANLALTHQQLWGIRATTNNNVYSGALVLGGNPGGDCNISGTSPGLVNTTCANAGTSTATLSTGLDLSSTLVGRVTTDDSVNTSDLLGNIADNSTLPFLGWFNFQNPFRAWGIAGTVFPDIANLGWCSHGSSCDIFDFAYRLTDSVLRFKSLDGQSTNTSFTIAGSCPNAVDGNVTLTDSSGRTYLINAIEISDDGIGNDDGLCQSDEACVYSPNIGAYQGHGSLVGTCNFTDGAVARVKMHQWDTNGY